MQFQLYAYVFSFLFAGAVAKVLATPEDFIWFGKYLWIATLYRACTCISKYMSVVRATGIPPFEAITHEDTVIFVLGIIMAIAYMMEMARKLRTRSVVGLLGGILLLLTAIQCNNRRLAWVSLSACFILIYFFVPPSPLKRRINRYLFRLAPVLVVYVAVGTGRPERVFAPLKALSSVKSEEDSSTRSRDVENVGLLVTLTPNPIMGTGWGIEYTEIDDEFSRGFKQTFQQYRYLPHNSLLGFVAFTGILGFALTWMVFPVAVFQCTRAYSGARSPPIRMVTLVSACIVVMVINQGWGDLGLFAQTPMMVASLAFAAAIRMPAAVRKELALTTAQSKKAG
jgi:O-antigen ligase